MIHNFYALLFISLLVGCSSQPPLEDYTLARTALQSAKQFDAARYAPSYWHRAEEAFRMGENYFRSHDYTEAEEQFIQARQLSEKAENTARVQRAKLGEPVP